MALQQRRAVAASRRIAVVATDAGRLLRLRGPFLRTVVAAGHKVLCVTGSAGKEDIRELTALGAETDGFALGPGPLRALRDRPATRSLAARLAAWKPSVVLGIGVKPMLMAALAARRLPDTRVVLIASTLDGLIEANDRRPRMGMRWIASRALGAAHALIVHNAEHAARLGDLDLLPAGLPVHVFPGAGVDLSIYTPTPLPAVEPGLVFAMITRRSAEKGIAEFAQAAARVKAKSPHARFILATWPSAGAAAQRDVDLQALPDAVELAAAPADVRGLISQCHVFVLPSHAEGMAHEVMEALACGRPAIASSIAGCREIVDERVSGVLVPPGDATALAAAMESFMRRPGQLDWMAQASRHKAVRRFDANDVTAGLLEIMALVQRR